MSDLTRNVSKKLAVYRVSFYFYSVVFYAFCIAIIVLPIIISSGLMDNYNKLLAIISAVCAGVATWSNLALIISNFQRAISILEIALAAYDVDKNENKLLEAFAQARSLSFRALRGIEWMILSDSRASAVGR